MTEHLEVLDVAPDSVQLAAGLNALEESALDVKLTVPVGTLEAAVSVTVAVQLVAVCARREDGVHETAAVVVSGGGPYVSVWLPVLPAKLPVAG